MAKIVPDFWPLAAMFRRNARSHTTGKELMNLPIQLKKNYFRKQ
jgi:hypothetical protein